MEKTTCGRQKSPLLGAAKRDNSVEKPSRKALSHIAHLNGLRALAFVGVVLFHFKHGCQGGFLGVDVFFVLSGYLMTRSIASQLASNTFSYPQFLSRRFWRLYPALLCTMVLSLALTYGFFSSEHAVQVARSSLASLVGVSNLLFLREDGYFGTSSTFKPLLHTWSLSVEWQFYLIWPILMALGSRYSSIARPSRPLVALCLISFVHGIILSSTAPSAAFFLLPGRAFEFGLGALASTSAPTISSSNIGNLMSAIGTSLIVLSFIYLNPSHGPPALIALPALFGALLVITSPSQVAFNRLYTSFFADYLGKISYSAYLVHWPVYVFFHNVFEQAAAPWHVEAVVVTGMMSASTVMYHHVEDEYRTGKRLWHKVVGLALVIGVVAGSCSSLQTNGWNWRHSPKLGPESAALSEIGMRREFDQIYEPHSESVKEQNAAKQIEFGYIPRNTEKRVAKGHSFDALILGDSFAAPLAGLFDELAAEDHQDFVLMSSHSCTPFLDATSLDPGVRDYANPSNNPRVHECKQTIRHDMMNLLAAAKTETVMLLGNWLNTNQLLLAMETSISVVLKKPEVRRPNSWVRTLSQVELTIMKLLDLQKKVIFIGMVPGAHYNVRACYAAKGPLSFLKQCPLESSLQRLDEGNGKMRHRLLIRRALGLLMKESPVLKRAQADGNLVYVDPYLSFCNSHSETCVVASKMEPYYYDDNHLTKNGSLLLKHDVRQALWLLKQRS